MAASDEGVRLQKVLAAAGIASRRNAELMIDDGRVEVNGEVVRVQGRRVDPDRDVIRVDGRRLPPPRRHAYLAFNKPRGVVCTMADPEGRPSIDDHLTPAQRASRLYHVGRLDTDSEGLLLLTNDGDFAQRMMHPSHEMPKTYVVEVEGEVTRPTVARLRQGVRLDDGWVNPDRVQLSGGTDRRTMLIVTLHSGRNRVVRRMFEQVGHPVRRLTRTQIGPLRMGRLPVGTTRELTRDELGALLDAAKL